MPRRPVTGPTFARWAAGYGAIRHSPSTRARVRAMVRALPIRAGAPSAWEVLHAADRIASAGMWLVVHETYARRVDLDGRPLGADDFKPHPEGHTGGALNMVPAYAGYLAVNALTDFTRAWIMGQGHCVAAVDSVNLLVGNMTPAHAERYALSDDGLARYVQDFYSYRLGEDGTPDFQCAAEPTPGSGGGAVRLRPDRARR